jgi:hypothetical protein
MRVIKKEKRMMEVDVTIDHYTLCDKCNEKIKKEDSYDDFKCEFVRQTGSSYPEGGSLEKQEMQMCQKCAVELVSLLRANGYRINESECDW